MENKVLATVNGIEITEQDVQAFLATLGQQAAMQIQSQPDGISRVVNELVNQNLMYLDAVDKELEQDEVFKEELEKTKKNLLIQYSVNKFLIDISATEDEIVKYYNENKEKFKKSETLRASHILVKEEKQANDILEEINNGLSFEDAAEKYSECPSKDRGGDLGEFSRGSMVPEFEEAAFKAEVGETTKPIQTQFGYHIIKVIDRNEESISLLEEVKEQVKQTVISLKQQESFLNRTNELKQKYGVTINL
ncbi:peptidyl-prolyl cis-trans isomerase, PpiC-type [Gottschalkia acidurici 9a]|uniref:Peptidyl-prolyl cis-trans isomerase, PpiC-type n=1 Tax=Gottschalkia acidurici (strain ATCC 7906 / DSM 604 / BCRC 14475 / CIP 104303 / KCTC 5404 / NCIMB 10678 / 9a) TaxID=1128398 RepID=K0AYC7_GOTA9|nr:peptidylprolyl isomerase [Gottschalkia acidurici]AFS78783.1 peptidyl-prolyl cis-trans isomerase, PpiC-type [Gottschalkia acidurici 9a]